MDSERKNPKPLATFSWYTGVYKEYELTVELFAGTIRWVEAMDPQWSDPPQEEVQTFEDFLESGPPEYFTWHLSGEGIESDIRRAVQTIQNER